MSDLAAFLVAKEAAGCAPTTLHWYEMFVGQFLDWSAVMKMPIKKPETVEAFLATLRKRDLSAYTISGCYRALSVYFNWLVQRRGLRVSPLAAVQAPKLPKSRRRHVSPAQYAALYASIDGDSWFDHRDRAILLTLYYSGLRANELLALKWADLDRHHHLLKVNAGKGGDDRDVPFVPAMLAELDGYAAVRPPTSSQRIFVAAGKRPDVVAGPLSYDGLKQMMRRRCNAAGLPRLGLHPFRHGFAMLFLNEGEMELAVVSKAMGHSSVEVTRRFYADYSTNSIRARYGDALANIQSKNKLGNS